MRPFGAKEDDMPDTRSDSPPVDQLAEDGARLYEKYDLEEWAAEARTKWRSFTDHRPRKWDPPLGPLMGEAVEAIRILESAIAFLSSRALAKGAFCLDSDGVETTEEGEDIASVCAWGALRCAVLRLPGVPDDISPHFVYGPFHVAANALEASVGFDLLRSRYGQFWNDDPETTKEEVLGQMAEAVDLLRSGWVPYQAPAMDFKTSDNQMLTFVTHFDPAIFLGRWRNGFGSVERFDDFCRFVWRNGRHDARGSFVYWDEGARLEDLAFGSHEMVARAEATPTINELAARFIREQLCEEPEVYSLKGSGTL
jgi:hypothetical protein